MMSKPNRIQWMIGAGTVLFGWIISFHILKSLWTLDENGLSQLNQKLPIWDFSNLWAAGVFALHGKVNLLFEVDNYREALRTLYTPLLTDQEWSYPPSMLLFAVPLGLLSVWTAYFVWTFCTIGMLLFAIRPLNFPKWALFLIAISPGAVMNMVVGQNGAFTAGLLLGGLLLAPTRPIVAGILFGILTMKPHFGLLVPFCLLASRNWKAIGSATVTTGLTVAMTAVLFGPSVWSEFRTVTAPLMTEILEAPYPQSYHTLALTVFVAGRSFGWGLGMSYALQIGASLLSIAAVIWLWSPSRTIPHETKVVLTGVLALIATPYGYVYDCIPLSVASAWLFFTERRVPTVIHAIAWLFPLFVPALALNGFGAGIVVILLYVGIHIALLLSTKSVMTNI